MPQGHNDLVEVTPKKAPDKIIGTFDAVGTCGTSTETDKLKIGGGTLRVTGNDLKPGQKGNYYARSDNYFEAIAQVTVPGGAWLMDRQPILCQVIQLRKVSRCKDGSLREGRSLRPRVKRLI